MEGMFEASRIFRLASVSTLQARRSAVAWGRSERGVENFESTDALTEGESTQAEGAVEVVEGLLSRQQERWCRGVLQSEA